MLWAYIFLSSNVVAAFQIQSTGFFVTGQAYFEDFQNLAIFSNRLMFVISIPLLFQSKGVVVASFNDICEKEEYEDKIISRNHNLLLWTRLLLFVAYSCTVLSYALGISDVADATVTLPFHLNGFIDEYRRNIFPILFSVYVYDCVSKEIKCKKSTIFCFFVWSIIEMFVRVSKGAVITTFLPVFIAIFIAGKLNKKSIIRYVIPVALVFIIFYPIIEKVRSIGEISFETLIEAYTSSSGSNGGGSSPFLRMFINGMDFIKVKNAVVSNTFFDFSRAPILYLHGGSAYYITYIIDGFSTSAHHSSGTTGIIDPLIWGGYGFCYLVVFGLACLSQMVDNKKLFREKRLYQLLMILLMKTLIMQRSISFFIDPLFMASFVAFLIEWIYVTLYYKNKI
jgi:hypothetical protein